eukprot:scaffold2820_cov64-Phaeocystis_antarctica.AAC.1
MALHGSLLGSASVWAEARLPLALLRGRHICGLAWPPSVVRAKVSETSLERCYLRNRPRTFHRTGKHDRRQQ